MKNYIIITIFTILNLSCKDNPDVTLVTPNTKFCWNITTFNLVFVVKECDKTETEIAAAYPNNYFYKSDEALKCWYEASSNTYIANCPQSLLPKIAPNKTMVQVNCGYCAQWYYREKRKYIPNNSFTYTPTTVTRLCGDTVQTLFRGREVFFKTIYRLIYSKAI